MDEDSALKIGNYSFSGKNLIVIGLIIVGAFFAWVLFHNRASTSTATTAATDTSGGTSGDSSGGDASAIGSLQSSIQSLSQAEAAQTAALGGIAKNADSAARDAAGARTDASVALNGVNKLLGGSTPAPKPAPAPGKPPAKTTTVTATQTKTVGTAASTKNTVTTKPPAGKGSSVGSDAWHITAAGLGLN